MLTLLAGYPVPALLGVAAAELLNRGHAVATLWLLLALLALVLLRVRNLYGWWTVIVAAAALVAITGWTATAVQVAAAHVATWLFLLGAPRAVVELAASRCRRAGDDSDAGQLAVLTRLPRSGTTGLAGSAHGLHTRRRALVDPRGRLPDLPAVLRRLGR